MKNNVFTKMATNHEGAHIRYKVGGGIRIHLTSVSAACAASSLSL